MSQVLQSAARNIQLLCGATRINLDPPEFHEQYVSFPLRHWHQIDGDFFIRSQSVGITLKGVDINLFYVLQDAVQYRDIVIETIHNKQRKNLTPTLAGDGAFSVENPCTFYLAGISSGNLRGISDLPISRDPATFEDRAAFLADLLFTQWIIKMMPLIQAYKRYRRLNLLVPVSQPVKQPT